MNIFNRKIIRIIIPMFVLIYALIPKYEYATSNLILGDINEDKIIDIQDLILISRHIVSELNTKHKEWTLKDNAFKAADVTKNDIVDTTDMLVVLRYIAASNNPEIVGKKHPEWLKIDENTKQDEVEEIVLNKTNLSLKKGDKEQLKVTIIPETAVNKNITWTTSDESIVTVDNKGMITANKKGTAVITARTENGKEAKCSITVIIESMPEPMPTPEPTPTPTPTPEIKAETITLNKTKLELDLSETKENTLKPTIKPSNTKDKTITWISENKKVAEVDTKGKVKAKGNGTTKIIAKTSNGKTAVCSITVKTSEKSVSLNKKALTLYVGKTATLTATIKPSTSSNKKITWESSNPKVAIVNNKGKITAKSVGTTKIKANTSNKKKSICTVTVKKEETTNVLFIGNSKTYYNKLDKTFMDLSKAGGKKVYATHIAYGGKTLYEKCCCF